MCSDADSAALYDVLNPWDPDRQPEDRFYHELVMTAGSVLDIGCGTGAMRGGCFAFETRHPQARAWEEWSPSNPDDVVDLVDDAGHALRVWHEVDSVIGDVVTFHGTTAEPDGTVLRIGRASLRFLDGAALSLFLTGAGFEIEAQYGDWYREPITGDSREIITIARCR